MKKFLLFFLILISLVYLNSCSRRGIPSLSNDSIGKEYDTSAFDYIYAEAIKQKIMGNAGGALKYLEQCITLNPESDAAYYQMSQIAFQLGDRESGKKYAIRAAKIDERNIWYTTFLAGIYYQEKNIDSTLLCYEKALKFHPENNEVRLTIGNLHSEKGEYEKANEIYRYLEEKYGTNERVTLLLARNLMNSGYFEAAELKIQELLKDSPGEILFNGILAEIYRKRGDSDKAVAVYKKLLELDSSNPQTLLSLTDFLINEKQYDNLLDLLNTIAVNDKISLESKIELLAKVIDTEDLIKEKENELEIMLRIFEESEENNNVISLLRPELYQKMNKKELAIKRLEELININPNYYFTWERLLLLYSETGDNEKLYTKGKECASRFNMSYMAKILYASAAMEKGLYEIAMEEIRKARIIAGNQKELLIQVQTMEADIYYRKGEYQRSFAIFKEAIINNPEDLIVLNNYAYYLAEQNQDLKEAEKMILYVINKERNNNTFLDTYAWVLYKNGKVKEAIKIMEEIMSKDNTPDSEWYEHYGYMMKAVRKCEIAIQYWKKAVDLSPEKKTLNKEIDNCKR